MATSFATRDIPQIQDSAGTRAAVHTEYVLTPSGLLVPKAATAGGNPVISLPAQGPYGQGVPAQAIAVGYNLGGVLEPIDIANLGQLGDNNGFLQSGQTVVAEEWVYNESGWDRRRNNAVYTVLSSADRTSSSTSPVQTNYNGRGVIVSVNVTAVSGTSPTLTIAIQGIDPVSGATYAILTASTAISATGIYTYCVYPGASGGFTQIVSAPLPRQWQVAYTIGGTTPSFTFSVGAAVVL